MSVSSSDFIDLLRQLGPLEWGRGSAPYDPTLRGRIRPPFVVWRFVNPNVTVEQRVVNAVREFHGNVDWEIYKGERNWVLEPLDVKRFQAQYRVDSEGAAEFARQFPELVKIQHSDFDLLLGHLRCALLPP